ncbi:MAG: chromosome segregation protein SMC [Actinomycetota bacterium]|nr:chromosome segregation protein SMC [Actinomycetota bacterium]
MFLRSLAIKGFKSFANPTTIEFSRGINVVVGPNGSGKSNIVDAISWTLGTQTPKSLRSSKMEDVIYGGGDGRSGAKSARVTMIIDNGDGQIPIDFAEVGVSRFLARGGDSGYELNGKDVRLIDVSELLADASIGKGQHIIISQGNLDEILDAKPAERRAIIEDASGIAKYRRRQERTMRRLLLVEEEANKASEVARELQKRIRPLERQAKAAKRHVDLNDEIAQLRAYILGSTYREQLELSQGGAQIEEELVEKIMDIEAKRASNTLELARLDAQLQSFDDSRHMSSISRLEAVRGELNVAVAISAERQRALGDRVKVLLDDSKVKEAKRSLEVLIRSRDEIEREVVSVEPLLADLETREREVQSSSREVNLDSIAQVEAKESELSTNANRLFTELTNQKAKVGQLISRQGDFVKAKERSQSLLVQMEAKMATSKAQFEQKSMQLNQDEALLEQLLPKLESAGKELEASELDLANLNGARGERLGVVKTLTQAIEELHSRSALRHIKKSPSPIGVVAELIEIVPSYEKAVLAALGRFANGVVSSSRGGALDNFLEIRGGYERSVSISRGPIAPRRGEGKSFLPKVSSFITYIHGEIEEVLLSLLDQVYVAETIEDAEAATRSDPNLVVVTLDGAVVTSYSFESFQGESAASRRALEEARESLAEIENELGRLRSVREAQSKEIVSLRERRRSLEASTSRLKSEVTQFSSEQSRFEEEKDRLEHEIESAKVSLESLADSLEEARLRLAPLEAEHRGVSEELIEVRATLSNMRKEMGELSRRRAGLRQERSQLEVRMARLQERYRKVVSDIEHTREQIEALTERFNEDQIEGDRLRAQVSEIEQIRIKALEKVSEVDSLLEIIRTEQRKILGDQDATTRAASALRSSIDQLSFERGVTQDELAKLRSDRQSATIRLAVLEERILRELELSPEVAMSIPILAGIKEDEAAQALTQREKELGELGPINHLAAMEVVELQEQARFMTEQLKDINASRSELKSISKSIDAEMRSVFMEAFTDINGHFDSLFKLLFPGGGARILLSDPDSPLDSGLDFDISIPGKALRRIPLLSGGERSLVALAFLFAVFSSRPSPFYVLDEVEAALDDLNLSRLLVMLSAFGEKSQLIIVSHQKRTMEIAQRLIGVSMAKDGISKVLVERLEDRQLTLAN